MTIQIKSVKRASGTYEGRNYDNTIIYGFVQNSQNKQILAGDEIELCKFKTEVFNAALDRQSAIAPSVASLIDKQMTPVYNKFGGCDDFILQADTSADKKKQ